MKTKFFTLWFAGVISTAIGLPYMFALQHDVLAKIPTPLWQVAIMAIVQTAILLAVAVFVGLKFSQFINLRALTLFESDIPFKENLKRIFRLAIPIGILVGVVIKIADLFFAKSIPQLIATADKIPFWKVILVAPYGGVVEELLLRLFIMTFLAWLLSKIFRITDVVNNNVIMWSAIIVAAVLFGLGHLPVTATITQITPIVVVRAILLNGIGGLVFGWLYWKKGLEYAIAAHFTTDIVLLVILPALLN